MPAPSVRPPGRLRRWPLLALSGGVAFTSPPSLRSMNDQRIGPRAVQEDQLTAVESAHTILLGRVSGATVASVAIAPILGVSSIIGALTRRRGVARQLVARRGLIGAEAPVFELKAVVDQEFVDVKLSDYRGKYVVLFFYPLDFTFVCPTEIIAFSDRINEFRSIGAEVLGVSVDSEYAHLAWIQMPRDDGGLGDIEFPLMSDLKKELATQYDVLSPDGTAYRGLFIIDREGIVQHSTINSMPFGRSIDETLRVLQAIQQVQNNPDEVCPAGWQPGDKTMRPDQDGVREYMSSNV